MFLRFHVVISNLGHCIFRSFSNPVCPLELDAWPIWQVDFSEKNSKKDIGGKSLTASSIACDDKAANLGESGSNQEKPTEIQLHESVSQSKRHRIRRQVS